MLKIILVNLFLQPNFISNDIYRAFEPPAVTSSHLLPKMHLTWVSTSDISSLEFIHFKILQLYTFRL